MAEIIRLSDRLTGDRKEDQLWTEFKARFNRAFDAFESAKTIEEQSMQFKDGNLVEIMIDGIRELVVIINHPYRDKGVDTEETRFAWTIAELPLPRYTPKVEDHMQPKLVAASLKDFSASQNYGPLYKTAIEAAGEGVDALVAARAAYHGIQMKAENSLESLKARVDEILSFDQARHERLSAKFASVMASSDPA